MAHERRRGADAEPPRQEVVVLTLIVVVVALVPVVAMIALFAWANRRERRQADLRARQIALTDAIHERLGAVAAPVVRRGRRSWQVRVAVPVEDSAATDAVLAIVRYAFSPGAGEAGALDIILTRQVTPDRTAGCGHDKQLSSCR
jgi:hypothetical protein